MIAPINVENLQKEETEIIDISKFLVSIDKEIKKPTPILCVKENDYLVDLFTEGNMSMIFGLAKSRKSTFLKSIVQAVLSGENTKLKSEYQRNKVAIIDTEQSEYDIQRAKIVIKAITREDYNHYTVAELNISQKKYLVEKHLQLNPECGLLIIDNIVHFLLNYNDATESAELLQWLIMIKSKYQVHLCLVLHDNPSEGARGKARGHLGTNLEQMCESIIEVRKDKEGKTRSIISPKMMRGKEFEPFYITQDYQGIPYLEDLGREEKRNLNITVEI